MKQITRERGIEMDKVFFIQIFFNHKKIRLYANEAKKDLIHATNVIEKLPHVFYINGKPCYAEWSFNPEHVNFIHSYELPQEERDSWVDRQNFNYKSDMAQFGIANLQFLEY
jgi:hypothetical protein